MKNEIIIIMGGPGSGKGRATEALRAAAEFNYIETGAMLRAAPADSDIAKIMASGELVPDDKLFELVASKMNEATDTLFDGFPRTLPQAQWLVEKYSKKSAMKVLYIDVPREIMIKRINNRLVVDGSGRADDADAAVIQRRLDTFYNVTMPAIHWLRENPNVEFITIDGLPPYPEVSKDIFAKLGMSQ